MKKIKLILTIIFSIILIVSIGIISKDLIQSHKEKKANEKLVEKIEQTTDESKGTSGKYDSLHQQNPDMVGWLSIDDTNINYPVMYTPDDIEKYLRKGFDGKYSKSGTLFLGEGWSENANYAIIFGHHMKDGSMFGSLVKYADKKYAQTHPIINFNTLNEDRSYEVVLAFYSRVYTNQDTNVFRYYKYTDLSDEKTFNNYIAQSKASAIYQTGVDVKYGDRILVLSTCNYHTENGRFVVLAKQK